MKILKYTYLMALILSLAFFSGCEDEPEAEVSPFVGNYVITSASLTEALVLNTNEIGATTAAAGTNITESIQQALLGSVDCTPSKSLIELWEDNSMYFSCEGTSARIDAGTWEEISSTVIKLNMNTTAIPSSPTGFVLTVNNIEMTGGLLKGETSVPLPKSMLAAMVTKVSGGLATLDMNNTPDALPVSFSIVLAKR